jgi:hypothetical protein
VDKNTTVATRMETAPEVTQPVSEASAILAIIERAAQNPDVDIDKMERLLAMQERIWERNAKQAFTEAKIAMRPKLPEISMRGRIIIREKGNQQNILQETPFARFEDIHEAVTPILSAHGFDLSFKNSLAPDGKVRVTTILSHVEGHSEETYFDLPHDSSGSKNAVQAVGSSTSYGKRYGVLNILNIRVSGEDDDGEKAGAPEPISEDQYTVLANLMTEVGANKEKFERFMKVESLSDLPATRFDEARKALEAKRKGPNA